MIQTRLFQRSYCRNRMNPPISGDMTVQTDLHGFDSDPESETRFLWQESAKLYGSGCIRFRIIFPHLDSFDMVLHPDTWFISGRIRTHNTKYKYSNGQMGVPCSFFLNSIEPIPLGSHTGIWHMIPVGLCGGKSSSSVLLLSPRLSLFKKWILKQDIHRCAERTSGYGPHSNTVHGSVHISLSAKYN